MLPKVSVMFMLYYRRSIEWRIYDCVCVCVSRCIWIERSINRDSRRWAFDLMRLTQLYKSMKKYMPPVYLDFQCPSSTPKSSRNQFPITTMNFAFFY